MSLLLLTICFLLASTDLAHAEPISAAIGLTALITSAGASAATAAAIGGFIVSSVATVGISLGLSMLNKAMAPKPQAGQALTGVETSVQVGGDIARQIPIGRTAVKGHLVYHNTTGTNNDFYQQVRIFSDWPCDSIDGLLLDGKPVTLSPVGGTEPQGRKAYNIVEYPGQVQVYFWDGTQTVADDQMINFSNPGGKWLYTSRLTGLCYVSLYYFYQTGSKLFDNGIPDPTFILKGAKLYDPRLDSTNGGTGSHRWNDPSTWAYSENPAVACYNFQRGFYSSNGELILGMGTPVYDLLQDTYVAGANICDENVSLAAGGTEKRYRIATILSADQDVPFAQTLEVILSTCAGYLYDYGGFYYFQAGTGYVSSATITDNDLVSSAPVSFSGKRSRADLINRIHGQFLATGSDFQPLSYAPQISASGVAADGEEIGKALDLLSVPSQFQAERIAQIRLRESRRQASAAIVLGFNFLYLQAGDWLTWNSTRYGNATWRIQTKELDPATQTIQLELVQIDSNVYSWTTADQAPAVAPAIRLQGASLASTVASFGIQAVALTGGDGSSIPALKFTWTPVVDPTIDAVVIEYRKVGTTTDTTRVSDPTPGDGHHVSSSGVSAGNDYEARATINTTPARITTWTPWVSITTTSFDFAALIDLPDIYDLIDAETPLGAPTLLNSGITSSLLRQDDGTILTRVTADWADVTGADSYLVELQEDAGNFISYPSPVSRYEWVGRVAPGTLIHIKVAAVTQLGTISSYSTVDATHGTHTVAANTTPPGTCSGLTATGAFQNMFLNWANPADPDLAIIEIIESSVNNRDATGSWTYYTRQGRVTSFTRTGMQSGDSRFYWIRPFNTSGVPGPYYPASATAGVPGSTQVISNRADFATNITPVEVLSALPTLGNFDGRTVALSTDDFKLYRFNGTAFTKTVALADATGTIATTQIADDSISTPKLKANSVSASKLSIGSAALNLVPNGGFEDGALGFPPLGWNSQKVGAAATVPFLNTTAVEGVQSIVLDIGAGGAGTSNQSYSRSPVFPVEGGSVYEVIAFVTSGGFGASASGAYTRVYWYDGASALISVTDNGDHSFNNSWTKRQFTLTAPSNARQALFEVLHYGPDSSVRQLIVDGVVVRKAIAATTIEDGAVKTDKLEANSVVAGKIAAGAVVLDKLAVGTSSNRFYNADGRAGEDGRNGLVLNYNPSGITALQGDTVDNWGLPGHRAGYIYKGGTPVGDGTGILGEILIIQPVEGGFSSLFSVIPGQNYEFSSYLSMHGARAYARILWYSNPSTYLSETTSVVGGSTLAVSGLVLSNTYNAATSLANWNATGRAWVIGQAPAAARYAVLSLLMYTATPTPAAENYMFSSGRYFGPASPNQLEPSPWSTGITTVIDGTGVRSGSIVTAHMVAGTIHGDVLSIDTIDANRIRSSTVLSNSVTVSGTGDSLSSINSRANDPISRANFAGGNLNGAGVSLSGTAVSTVVSNANDPISRANTVGGNLNGAGVQLDGTAVSTVVANAIDPAARVNAHTTQIDPGKITISGSTTLDDWRDVTEIKGGAIKSYSIKTEKLLIGDGSNNLVLNSDNRIGIPTGYSLGGNNHGLTIPLPLNLGHEGLAVPGSASMYHEWSPLAFLSGTYQDTYVSAVGADGVTLSPFPANASVVYEACVSAAVYNCLTGDLYIEWINSGGTIIGYSGPESVPTGGLAASSSEKLTKIAVSGGDGARLRVTGTAPAGTTGARLLLRQWFNGGSSPYIFWSGLYFARTGDPAYVTPYSTKSTTSIHGGQIITNSIKALSLRSNIIDSTHLRTDVAVVTVAAQLANAVITTAKIDNLQVTNAKVDNLTLLSGKISDGELSQIKHSRSADGGTTAAVSIVTRRSELLLMGDFTGRSTTQTTGMVFGALWLSLDGGGTYATANNNWQRDGGGQYTVGNGSIAHKITGLSLGANLTFRVTTNDNFNGGGTGSVGLTVIEMTK